MAAAIIVLTEEKRHDCFVVETVLSILVVYDRK